MKELKLVALSNGIHLFEGEKGVSDIGNIVKADMTNEALKSVASYMTMKSGKGNIAVEVAGKKYMLSIIDFESLGLE